MVRKIVGIKAVFLLVISVVIVGYWLFVLGKPALSQTALTSTVKVEVLKLCTGNAQPSNRGCARQGEPLDFPREACHPNDRDYGCVPLAGSYGNPNGAETYPYAESQVTLTMKEYVKNVVPNEANSPYDPFEFLKAQAVVSRMYGHVQYKDAESYPEYINNSTEKQVFIPKSDHPITDDAVEQTEGILLTYADSIINALFSANHGVNSPRSDMTREGDTDYLKSVYDPVVGGTEIAHGWGMAQLGAINWAKGLLDGNNYYPIWDFLRILAHYYTAIEFQNIPNAHNGYRFNVIQISNLPDGYTFTPARTLKEGISLIVQNSGTLPWYPGQGGQTNCAANTYNMALSYHLYETDSQGNSTKIACGDPNVPGGNRCFEGVRTRLCVPFAAAETPPGGTFLVEGATVKIPDGLPVGKCYNLRWDVELNNNHTERTWISGLQLTPWQARWPTQDTRICYLQSEVSTPNSPQNPHSDSGHEVNRWSNNPNLTIAWDAPPDGPVSGYEYRYQGAGSDIADGQWHSTNNRQVSFTATQDGNHSLQLRAVLDDQKSSSIEVGPYLLDRQPPSLRVGSPLENWVTTNQFTLDWHSMDTASGLSHYDVYSAANPNAPWTPLALNTTTEMVSITGNDDQTFYFRVIAYDRAGNSGEYWKMVQIRTFPYLSVSPGSLYRTFILTNTPPSLESLQILNNGGRVMNWTAETNFPYLTLPTTTGIDDTILPITLTHPLTYGLFRGVLTITGGSDTRDSPAIVPVAINVVDKLDYYLPLIIKNEE